MIDFTQEFDRACQELDRLRSILEKAKSLDLAPGEREQLDALGQALDESAADAKKKVPDAVSRLEQELAETQKSAEQSRTRIDELEKRLAELEKTAASPPRPEPAPAIDPRHGRILAAELLKRFGTKPGVAPATSHAGDVWQLSSGEWADPEISEERPDKEF